MIRDAAKDFAQRDLITDVIERDTKAAFPTKHIKTLSDLGFMGMMVVPKSAGGGMDWGCYVLAVEEICEVDGAVGVGRWV